MGEGCGCGKLPWETMREMGRRSEWREVVGWEVREKIRMMGQGERRKPHLGQWGFE